MTTKHGPILILVLLFSVLLVLQTQAQTMPTSNTIFLPFVMTAGEPTPQTLTDQVEQAVESALAAANTPLQLDYLNLTGTTLTLKLTSADLEEIDAFTFQTVLPVIDTAVSQVLIAQKSNNDTLSYEIFVNGQYWQGNSEPIAAKTQSELAIQVNTSANPKVVLSPGHGWYQTASGAWYLERSYHNGIVEDFINAELTMNLAEKLRQAGVDVRGARALDKNGGNHLDSGYPWWQMGSATYVGSLGAPTFVAGGGFSDYQQNIVAPPRYANWIGADMLINLHNNGGGGCGTEIWYDSSNGYQDQSRRLATLIHDHLMSRLRAEWNSDWCDRGVKSSNGGYGENRIFNGPAVIVELAFMDNPGDNAALQNTRFRNIAMQAIQEAIMIYYGGAAQPVATTFVGNPVSRLYFDQNNERLNLEVCADNLPGQTVYAQVAQPNKITVPIALQANGRCVTFYNLDGPGPVQANTPYATRVALNGPPNAEWPVPCFDATGGRGLCDTVMAPGAAVSANGDHPALILPVLETGYRWKITAGYNTRFHGGNDNNQADLMTLDISEEGHNSAGQTVIAAASGEVWHVSSSGCQIVLRHGNYFTSYLHVRPKSGLQVGSSIAAGSPIGKMENNCPGISSGAHVHFMLNTWAGSGSAPRQFPFQSSWKAEPFMNLCGVAYPATGIQNEHAYKHVSPCATATPAPTPNETTFASNATSRLYFDQGGARINLEVCAANLLGQRVQAQLSRPGKTFGIVSKTASGNCVTFFDMDGDGPVLANTFYTTRAALNQPPNGSWPAPCFAATGGQGLCDTNSFTPSAPQLFSGNPSSRLFFDQNGERLNLEVCADNLPGQTVYVRVMRPGRVFPVVVQQSSSRCITFYDLDDTGPVLADTTYTTLAALNQPPNDNWPVPCFAPTGGQGLCDAGVYTPVTAVFSGNPTSRLFFDQNNERINLEVCAENLPGRTVHVQMWRAAVGNNPAREWNVSQSASSRCLTFWNLDEAGLTIPGVVYYTVASLDPLGAGEAARRRGSCFATTEGHQLCDALNRSAIIANASSQLTINTDAVTLRVCGDNLPGERVYVQMWRRAVNGNPARTWNVDQVAGGTCTTFSDLDGSGPTVAGVTYFTVAGIQPLGSNEAAQQRTACYAATGAVRLCDAIQR